MPQETPEDLQAKIDSLEAQLEDQGVAMSNLKLQLEDATTEANDLKAKLVAADSAGALLAAGVKISDEKIKTLEAGSKEQTRIIYAYRKALPDVDEDLEVYPKPAGSQSPALTEAIESMAKRLKIQGFLAEVNNYEKAKRS